MLADSRGRMYPGSCVVVVYGRRFAKEAALVELTTKAEALGLHVTITRLAPTSDPALSIGADSTESPGADDADDINDATMERTPGP